VKDNPISNFTLIRFETTAPLRSFFEDGRPNKNNNKKKNSNNNEMSSDMSLEISSYISNGNLMN